MHKHKMHKHKNSIRKKKQMSSRLVLFPARNVAALWAICSVLSLSACESLNPLNWFGDEEHESPYAGQEAPGSDQDYPDVSSVPARPAEGLIADTRDRLYEEDEKQQEQNRQETGIEQETALEDASLTASGALLSSAEPTPAPVQPVIADTVAPLSAPPAPFDIDAPSQQVTPEPIAETTMDASSMDEPIRDETIITQWAAPTPKPEQRFVSMKMGTLFFPFGSSYISLDDRRHIKKVVDLANQKNARLRVVGHASSFTNDMPLLDHQLANFSVSLERAQAIANLILANGFDSDRLSVRALSDSAPLFLEVMPAGQRGNQRAEIHMEY